MCISVTVIDPYNHHMNLWEPAPHLSWLACQSEESEEDQIATITWSVHVFNVLQQGLSVIRTCYPQRKDIL